MRMMKYLLFKWLLCVIVIEALSISSSNNSQTGPAAPLQSVLNVTSLVATTQNGRSTRIHYAAEIARTERTTPAASDDAFVQTELDRELTNKSPDLSFIGALVRFVFYLRTMLQVFKGLIWNTFNYVS